MIVYLIETKNAIIVYTRVSPCLRVKAHLAQLHEQQLPHCCAPLPLIQILYGKEMDIAYVIFKKCFLFNDINRIHCLYHF